MHRPGGPVEYLRPVEAQLQPFTGCQRRLAGLRFVVADALDEVQQAFELLRESLSLSFIQPQTREAAKVVEGFAIHGGDDSKERARISRTPRFRVVLGTGMKNLLNSLGRWIGALVAGTAMAAMLGGCGGYVGMAYGDNYRPKSYYWNDPYWSGPRYPYNGEWHGDYVYYKGRWYLYGQGTPYYDPWGWYW